MHRWLRLPHIAIFLRFGYFVLQNTIADRGPVIALNQRAVFPNQTEQIVVPCLIFLNGVKLAVVMNQGQSAPLRCLPGSVPDPYRHRTISVDLDGRAFDGHLERVAIDQL